MFKYSDSEPSQVSVNSHGQFRSSEDILAWANDVVGGNDEELPFQGLNKRDVLIKALILLVYHVSGKVFELILRFSEVLCVVRMIQSVHVLCTQSIS